MDICDKMSKLLQCGNVNSPEAVDQLIKILENSLTVKKFKTPRQNFYFSSIGRSTSYHATGTSSLPQRLQMRY